MSPHHHSRALALSAIGHLEPSIIFGSTTTAGRFGRNILPSSLHGREGESSGGKWVEAVGSTTTSTSYRASVPSHRSRHRSSAITGSGHSLVRGVSSSSTGAGAGTAKQSSTTARRKALVFAGLGSYPHTPSQLTPSSHTIWARASSALLGPHPEMHYTPDGIHPQNINGTGHAGGEVGEEAWLRGWLAGKRGMGEILREPDLQAAFVLTSNIALLASAQEHNCTPTLLPQDTSHLLGYGFIGTLTCLVATDRVKLEDAVRLARFYAVLKGPSLSRDLDIRERDPNHKSFLTTLLTLSEDISKTRKHSLSETILPTTHASSSGNGENPEQALRHVLGIIDQLQDSQGWDRCFLHDGTYPGAASMDEPVFGTRGGEGEKAVFRGEWAGEAMINSCRSLTISGTPHAVIKIVDRLRSAGLATPVMDMHIAAPYHTPLMGSAVHNFRRALKSVKFYPKGGANSIARGVGVSGSGEKREGKEEAVVLDGITAQPLPMHDIHASLLSYLVRPLQWHKTTQALYRGQAQGEESAVSEIQIVGQGGRGLGAHILRDIRAFNQAEGQAGPEMMDFDAHGAKKPTSGRKSR